MINQGLVEKNKGWLSAEKMRLQELLARIGPEYEDVGNKEDENATEVEMYERNLAEERDVNRKLQKVVSALKRIEDGTYGTCVVGGEEIPEERLEAAPEADTCLEHA